MNFDEMIIVELFWVVGYCMGVYGKWYNGMQYLYYFNVCGFDEFYGFCSGYWGNYFDLMLEWDGRIIQGEGFCIDDFINNVMEFMEVVI